MQVIPPCEPLLANMPSGREYHVPQRYQPPELREDDMVKLRAPPDPEDASLDAEEGDSSNEDESRPDPVGAFPGTSREYSGGVTYC